jgi:restriction endonuclease Mrr
VPDPTPYNIALWIIAESENKDIKPIRNIINEILINRLKGTSPDEISDLTEKVNDSVVIELGNIYADDIQDGRSLNFEIIDDEYIKFSEKSNQKLLDKLYEITPDSFEKFCVLLLKKIGAKEYRHNNIKYDGVVDFFGFYIPIGDIIGLPYPSKSKPIIIGQAKRYKKGHRVKLSEVQKFIGGALKKNDELKRNFGILTPTLYIYWTTSEFNKDAKEYCKAMGIWYLDGTGLTNLANLAGIESFDENIS